jgi:hypothetical protein
LNPTLIGRRTHWSAWSGALFHRGIHREYNGRLPSDPARAARVIVARHRCLRISRMRRAGATALLLYIGRTRLGRAPIDSENLLGT